MAMRQKLIHRVERVLESNSLLGFQNNWAGSEQNEWGVLPSIVKCVLFSTSL